MSFAGSNLRYLRKLRGLTQEEFANKLDIKRSLLGAYEEERAEPRIEVLEQTLERAEAIAAKEQAMIDALRAGEDVLSVDNRFNYENMLKTK